MNYQLYTAGSTWSSIPAPVSSTARLKIKEIRVQFGVR